MFKVQWSRREEEKRFQNLFVTVDGTDCRICEPTPFSTDWYSHKFSGPGVRYEIAVSISKSMVVWANGPYPCGLYPDQKFFNSVLAHKLYSNEFVLADKGYSGPRCVNNINGDYDLSSKLLDRHETFNKRIKNFNVLRDRFRHDLYLHSFCFHAVLNFVSVLVQTTEPLFDI